MCGYFLTKYESSHCGFFLNKYSSHSKIMCSKRLRELIFVSHWLQQGFDSTLLRVVQILLSKLISLYIQKLSPNHYFINSRTAIAGAIIDLFLVFYFVVAIFIKTKGRQSHFKSAFCSFVHANSTEVRVWRDFSLLVEHVFCSFAWLNFWSHLTYLTLKNDFLTLKLTFIYFNSKR